MPSLVRNHASTIRPLHGPGREASFLFFKHNVIEPHRGREICKDFQWVWNRTESRTQSTWLQSPCVLGSCRTQGSWVLALSSHLGVRSEWTSNSAGRTQAQRSLACGKRLLRDQSAQKRSAGIGGLWILPFEKWHWEDHSGPQISKVPCVTFCCRSYQHFQCNYVLNWQPSSHLPL